MVWPGVGGRSGRSGVMYLRHDWRSLSGVLGLITRNPIGKQGQKGPQICLGMGPCRLGSIPVALLAGAPRSLENAHVSRHGMGESKARLRQVEATYRKMLLQDFRNLGLLDEAAKAPGRTADLFSERCYIRCGYERARRCGYERARRGRRACGHGIALVMLSPRRLSKAEFRNRILESCGINDCAATVWLIGSLARMKNSWSKTKIWPDCTKRPQ